MITGRWFFVKIARAISLSLLPAGAQSRQASGHSDGTISTEGDLVVMTLNEGALGTANLFDLAGRTVRFKPEGTGYRLENGALHWDHSGKVD